MFYQSKKTKKVFHILVCFFAISMTHAQDFNGSINISYVENDKKSWWTQNNNFGFKFYPFYQQTKLELKKKL